MAQSRWHVRQDPEEEKVLEEQLETHFPADASWLLAHVRQNVGDPAQVPQDALQAKSKIEIRFTYINPVLCHLPTQVTLSWDETVVPEGQLPTHVPLERNDPGKQEVHFF